MNNLAKLYAARELLMLLAWRDIRIKYKQSVMGLLWAVLMPGLIVAAGVLVRYVASEWSGKEISRGDVASVMVRAVVWAFVVAAIRFGTSSLIGNTSLVSKIAFPKETFPIAAVFSALVDFAIAATVVLASLALIGWVPTLHALLAIPLLLVLFLLTTGLALLLSAANLFFRDVKYLVEVFLTYAIFFTPVLYDVEMLGKWKNLVMLNPFAPLLEALAKVMVKHELPEFAWTAYSIAFSMLALAVGYSIFKRLETRFAESV